MGGLVRPLQRGEVSTLLPGVEAGTVVNLEPLACLQSYDPVLA